MKYENITKEIIGAAYDVHNQLGFGYLESVYQNSMIIELGKRQLKVEFEKQISVYYDDQVVGKYQVDLLIENKIIAELKSVESLNKAHEVQLVNYLNCLRKEIGLLINFGPSVVEVKRKFRQPDTFKNRFPPKADDVFSISSGN
jgi:GxxExxY protein